MQIARRPSKFYRENILMALNLAIKEQEKYEHDELKYTKDSALLQTWKEFAEEVKQNDVINLE